VADLPGRILRPTSRLRRWSRRNPSLSIALRLSPSLPERTRSLPASLLRGTRPPHLPLLPRRTSGSGLAHSPTRRAKASISANSYWPLASGACSLE
jgi:hypothetical protein